MSNWKENIQVKMKERELDVSSSAWHKLEKQLNDVETTNTSNKKRFYWIIGTAASICLLFVIGLWLFNDGKTSKTPIIVKKEEPIKETNLSKSEVQSISVPKIILKETVTKPKSVTYAKKVNVKKAVKVEKKKNIEIKKLDDLGKENKRLVTVNENTISKETKIINETDYKSSDDYLGEALKQKRIKKSEKLIVNQENLLDDIEDEIYQEKSPTILEKLTHQAKKFQVAFSERNQEK